MMCGEQGVGRGLLGEVALLLLREECRCCVKLSLLVCQRAGELQLLALHLTSPLPLSSLKLTAQQRHLLLLVAECSGCC